MRSIRVLRNVVTNYARFFVNGLIGFLLTPLMVRHLGDRDYGVWVTIFSLTGYFGLFDQAIRPSLVRYVSRDHTRGDWDGLSRTLSSALALNTVAGVVTMAATVVFAAGFPAWFKIGAGTAAESRVALLLIGASLAIGFPFGVFGATLSGLQRYDISNTIGVAVNVVRGLLFVAVLKLFHGGLIALAWVSFVMSLIGYVVSWVYARRLLPQVRLTRGGVTREHVVLVGSYSGIALVGAVANTITFQTDALVITAFLTAAAVTPFALAAGLVETVRQLVYSATWVLSPTASEFDTRGEREKLHEMMIAGSKYSVLLSWPVLLALVIFGRDILTTWVGAKYAGASTLLTILALPTLLSLPQSTTYSVLFGVGRHKGVVALSLANALLNLGLSLLWVKPYGLTGVALGTAIPLALVSGIGNLIYGCHALEMPWGRTILDGMVKPGLVGLTFAIPALAVRWYAHPVGWIPLFAACLGCWLVFALVAWRFSIDGRERARWARMVTGLFGATAVAEAPR